MRGDFSEGARCQQGEKWGQILRWSARSPHASSSSSRRDVKSIRDGYALSHGPELRHLAQGIQREDACGTGNKGGEPRRVRQGRRFRSLPSSPTPIWRRGLPETRSRRREQWTRQDAPHALASLSLARLSAGWQRQPDGEAGALAGGGLDLDRAAVVLDDAVADRQAQAGPLADRLGGEEGVEDPVADRRVDAVAVVDAPRSATWPSVGGRCGRSPCPRGGRRRWRWRPGS